MFFAVSSHINLIFWAHLSLKPPPAIIHGPSPATAALRQTAPLMWWNGWHVQKAGGGFVLERNGRKDGGEEEADQKWADVWSEMKRGVNIKHRWLSCQLNNQDESVQIGRKGLLGVTEVMSAEGRVAILC